MSRWMMGAVLAATLGGAAARGQQQPEGDLNRTIRVKPSETAARIGTAVAWAADFDSALARARETGKPVFWYVSTIPGTFTDRKVEIDRYMLAGPFSWPPIIESLNGDYVPLRQPPDKARAATYELVPYQFVEPGFLIIEPDGSVSRRVDRLTTLHPLWLERLIVRGAGDAAAGAGEASGAAPAGEGAAEIADGWRALQTGASDLEREKRLEAIGGSQALLLAGMFAFRRGEHEAARQLFQRAAGAEPDSSWAWKAAAEAEGFGPFVRGMEVFCELPEAAYRAGVDSPGSAAPPATYGERDLWERGVSFLLPMQRGDGGFFDSDYDFGGYDSLPNVHAAVTALVGMALIEARERAAETQRAEIERAIARAAAFVQDDRHLNPRDRDEILWAHAYRVRFLARWIEAGLPTDAEAAVAALNHAIDGLEGVQLERGGWYHEYANPWVTATALAALHHGRRCGGQVDAGRVQRGVQALRLDRFENGAYPYFSRKRGEGDNPPATLPASAGRMAVCELALWYWRAIDDGALQRAAEVALQHHDLLQAGYKYDNHTSTHAYGGFFFWYDMRARSELIARVADAAQRQRLAEAQRALILGLPEVDGAFVDSHELGRCYGTAMALLSLAELDSIRASQE